MEEMEKEKERKGKGREGERERERRRERGRGRRREGRREGEKTASSNGVCVDHPLTWCRRRLNSMGSFGFLYGFMKSRFCNGECGMVIESDSQKKCCYGHQGLKFTLAHMLQAHALTAVSK